MEETVDIDGKIYRVVVFSNIIDDTMCLELWDAAGSMVACIDYHDEGGRMTFDCFMPELPLGVVEWMVANARKRLPPATA